MISFHMLETFCLSSFLSNIYLLKRHGDPLFLCHFWSTIIMVNKWTKLEKKVVLAPISWNDLKITRA